MSDNLMAALAGLLGASVGSLLGGWLVWRQVRARLEDELSGKLCAAIAPALQSHLDHLPSKAMVAPTASIVGAEIATGVDAMRQAAALVSASAERSAQRLADAVASGTGVLTALRAMPDRIAASQQVWQDMLERLPQTLRQTLQIELDLLARQQAQRDALAVGRDDQREKAAHAHSQFPVPRRQCICAGGGGAAPVRFIATDGGLGPAARTVACTSAAADTGVRRSGAFTAAHRRGNRCAAARSAPAGQGATAGLAVAQEADPAQALKKARLPFTVVVFFLLMRIHCLNPSRCGPRTCRSVFYR